MEGIYTNGEVYFYLINDNKKDIILDSYPHVYDNLEHFRGDYYVYIPNYKNTEYEFCGCLLFKGCNAYDEPINELKDILKRLMRESKIKQLLS